MRYPFILLCWLLPAALVWAGDDPQPADFAAGYYLDTTGSGPIYSLQLPEDVYRTVQHSDLSDIRIFNSGGEEVPHELRKVAEEVSELREKAAVPFFPLLAPADGGRGQSDLALRVKRNEEGTVVEIEPVPANEQDKKHSGYLLDFTGQNKSVRSLEVFWDKTLDSSVFTVTLQHSHDLVHWSTLVSRATIADLEYAGQRVEKRTVYFSSAPRNYVKLTWQEKDRDLLLTQLFALSEIVESRRERRWESLSSGKITDGDVPTIDFTSSLRMSVDGAQVRLPEPNGLASLTILSRPDKDSNWRTRCSQVFYDIRIQGAPLHNEPCSFPPNADPLWRIAVNQDGAGLLKKSTMAALQLGWTPHELIFLARGTPPFLFAFGSGRIGPEQRKGSGNMIRRALASMGTGQAIDGAILGKRIHLGGDKALTAPQLAPPWKTWLLWLVLVLGVLFLAWMAKSLLREMKKPG